MLLPVWLLVWGSLLISAIAAPPVYHPEKYQTSSLSQKYAANASMPPCITLSSDDTASASFDYGTEIGGFPLFSVHSLSGPVQIEAKYSESRVALDQPFADGPWTFSNELANTFRVETFNVTDPGDIQSFFIQGGLRWQSLRLLSPQSTVEICRVGIRSTNDRTTVHDLPGYFECSNPMYNEIWALGPRTVQQACIANNSAPSTWEVTKNDGVFIRGQQPAQSVKGASFANYTLSFRSKIVRGGTGWKVASGVGGYGPYFVLTSQYPSEATFLNTNHTLVPSNTLVVGYGYNLVNQTSLATGAIKHFPLSFNVEQDRWYTISTTINQTGYSVSIDDNQAIFIDLNHLQTPTATIGGSGSLTGGTWGFGPFQDQTAYVKDVQVHARNGTLLYHNHMTSSSVPAEYGVMSNTQSVCLDGAKRDRLVWSGDFAHTARMVSTSTHRQDFLTGTLEYILGRQAKSGPYKGFFAMSPTMGEAPEYTLVYNSFGLLDYQMLFLNSFAGYYLDYADDKFLQQYWPQAKQGIQALLPLVDISSGLVASSSKSAPGAFFQGPSNGTAPSALFVYTLQKMSSIAEAVGDSQTARSWNQTATHVARAINHHLWNEQTGTYMEALGSANSSSIVGTAWAVLSDVASATQAQRAIKALSSLRLGIGFKDSSSTASSPSANLSPNLSGFLLEALFYHSRENSASSAMGNSITQAISVLLDRLWPAMVSQDDYYTGTTWEYLYPDGRPGLDFYTSHAHPWSAAPTYVFQGYVLGIQPVKPGFVEWTFRPVLDSGLDIFWAKGRVPTPHGAVRASWKVEDGGREAVLRACAPRGTMGRVALGHLRARSVTVDGRARNGEIVVEGGKCERISVGL